MARKVLDEDLRIWEAFASTGAYGYADHSRVVFRCASDPGERSRAYTVAGDKSEAEALVVGASLPELRELLAAAEPLG